MAQVSPVRIERPVEFVQLVVIQLVHASVSVRKVLEPYESSVIQGWWPDSRRITDVDEQEPRPLRPQQVAICSHYGLGTNSAMNDTEQTANRYDRYAIERPELSDCLAHVDRLVA